MADGTARSSGGGSATHVAHCNNIHPYFGHWCDVLPLIGGRLFRMPRGEDAKRHGLLRNILISPLEGEKKFLSELRELRNFREGYKKYKNKDRRTESAMTDFGENERSCFCRSALLCRQGKISCNKLFQHKTELKRIEPLSRISNAHYHSQRTAPSPRWGEGIDFVIINNFSETVFSRFTSHFSHKRTAFTLAEVLITLGIIGIVACMTLPSIINKYQSKVFETTFKKQYSVLQNAIDYSTMVNAYQNCYLYFPKGTISYQFKLDDCVALGNDLVENLKLTPISKTVLNNYKRSAEIHATGGNSINWACSYDYSLGEAIPYVSSDGVIFMISVYAQFFPSIIIDVNGEKGPNKWGYDVFFMVLSNHNEATSKVLLTDEYCSIIEKGGRFPRTILQNKQLVDGSDLGITWK